nr:protein mss51, mitochondrial [Quercus suber]
MASQAICTRCMRLATRYANPPLTWTASSASFSSAIPLRRRIQSQQQRRRINHSSRARAPIVEPTSQARTPGSAPPPAVDSSKPAPENNEQQRVLLRTLFHSFSQSPSPSIRKRAAFMRQNAYCPHPDHQQTRVSSVQEHTQTQQAGGQPPAHVHHECPDCGIPVSCSEEHFADDYESHLEICDLLKQINEDDHDLHSGRFFPEFEYPGPQLEEAQINMTNWDTLLYTREFQAIDAERPMRQVTRLLTYPATIASVLHELSPYGLKDRLLPEGLRSLSGGNATIAGLRPNPPPVRLFILGARAESSLPREIWLQLSHLFPRASFHLVFIGPESMANRDHEFPLPERTSQNPFGAIIEDRLGGQLKISTYVEYFHTLHNAQHFYPYDPYFDAFVLFHPGLGHPASSHEWAETLPQLLETKVPIICTGYTEYDMQRDIKWVQTQAHGEADLLLKPGENRFRSLRWDLNDLDPGDITCGNWGVWAFRGKRYEADAYRGKDTGSGGWDK